MGDRQNGNEAKKEEGKETQLKSTRTRKKSPAATTKTQAESPTNHSTSQTSTLWDGINDTKYSGSCDKTYETEYESYGDNSLESSDDDSDRRKDPRGNRQAPGSCIMDTANLLESFLVTTRDMSFAVKRSAVARAKMAAAFMEAREKARKEERKRLEERLEEEKRRKREQQLQEEMRIAREEVRVGSVTNLW
eukprot:CAMPEP_0172565022 /NCGR_PEP_ID=MMETSP1067-20121228/106643_1 /TAXON_ID=265564 ORGANISM="Thalassiosira punctigera, Strain Tpunct2005C2" /NCGR_SAMPLE_ID=MMETSP1067 /ASSEMBLY_ACC=CAM_ASM_000444 /LENGTH=191 /DNA_ID=CAMNT_0013355827 /DNA_START=172 /DNA_END=744 /DNA_ORIENTATION=+